jgi:hypothetical protein
MERMDEPEVIEVDPQTLHLPPARAAGADPAKLQRQISKYGRAVDGMPKIFVYRCADGALQIYDGVTRATRVAKFLPGQAVEVEVIGDLRTNGRKLPTIGERLP